jgi:hypothetical protein
VPAETDSIQVNFCKNPSCGNYGVAPKNPIKRGRGKSNLAVSEERARFLKDLTIAPEPSCPDTSCSNHNVPVGKGYQSIGLSPSAKGKVSLEDIIYFES